ncbi:MAG: class I SAM-dependent methyltransferase [Acidobacteriaceae bacterium]|nr:class I SAM-dependent methyltransferase [Acidobacteriaceae bacterium]
MIFSLQRTLGANTPAPRRRTTGRRFDTAGGCWQRGHCRVGSNHFRVDTKPADFERNRSAWNASSDAYQARHGQQLARNAEAWGVWSLPESDLQLLGEVAGRDVLEYGCGGAQWSIALARRGARVTALDNSERQLGHARSAITTANVDVRTVHAPAERTPFEDAAFDVVFCDHGAMSFADPQITIPEVARILRANGILAFSVEHPMHAACWDDAAGAVSTSLQHPYHTLGRIEDPTDASVNFVRPIATYVALLHTNGFALEALLEPRPQADSTTTFDGFAPLSWARDYPAELMIRARKHARTR